MVTVRFFAAARAAAGTEATTARAATLGELRDALAEAHGPGLAKVLGVASFLVNGTAARGDAPLAEGATVDVLPPFAGG